MDMFKKLLFVALISTDAMAQYYLPEQLPIDLLQPTGRWFSGFISHNFPPIDSCGNGPINKGYDYLFESFEEAKEHFLNVANTENEDAKCFFERDELDSFSFGFLPNIYSNYYSKYWGMTEYFNRYPNNPYAKKLVYKCINIEYEYIYSVEYYVTPEYECLDGSCNSTQPACDMDVYARNLGSAGGKPFGHVGFIINPQRNDATILEVLKEPPIIHFDKKLSTELSENPIWGIRYGYGTATKNGDFTVSEAELLKIEGISQSYFCPQYTLLPKYQEGDFDHCAEFRCDTFIKYLFNKYLNTDLPPYNISDAPKDLFNAFINQRGEIANPAYQNIEGNYSQPVIDILNSTWDDYLDAKSTDDKLKALDGLNNIEGIPYSKLLDALRNIEDSEIKSKLLFIIFKKDYVPKPNSQEKNDIKQILDHLIKQSKDAKIISNSILVAHNILDSNDFNHYLNLVIDNISTVDNETRRFITNTILHVSYQDIILNGNLSETLNNIISGLNRDDVAIVYAIHVIKTPKNKLKKSKKYLLEVINSHKKKNLNSIQYKYYLNYGNKFIEEALNRLH